MASIGPYKWGKAYSRMARFLSGAMGGIAPYKAF